MKEKDNKYIFDANNTKNAILEIIRQEQNSRQNNIIKYIINSNIKSDNSKGTIRKYIGDLIKEDLISEINPTLFKRYGILAKSDAKYYRLSENSDTCKYVTEIFDSLDISNPEILKIAIEEIYYLKSIDLSPFEIYKISELISFKNNNKVIHPYYCYKLVNIIKSHIDKKIIPNSDFALNSKTFVDNLVICFKLYENVLSDIDDAKKYRKENLPENREDKFNYFKNINLRNKFGNIVNYKFLIRQEILYILSKVEPSAVIDLFKKDIILYKIYINGDFGFSVSLPDADKILEQFNDTFSEIILDEFWLEINTCFENKSVVPSGDETIEIIRNILVVNYIQRDLSDIFDSDNSKFKLYKLKKELTMMPNSKFVIEFIDYIRKYHQTMITNRNKDITIKLKKE